MTTSSQNVDQVGVWPSRHAFEMLDYHQQPPAPNRCRSIIDCPLADWRWRRWWGGALLPPSPSTWWYRHRFSRTPLAPFFRLAALGPREGRPLGGPCCRHRAPLFFPSPPQRRSMHGKCRRAKGKALASAWLHAGQRVAGRIKVETVHKFRSVILQADSYWHSQCHCAMAMPHLVLTKGEICLVTV
jgi:hypothetical protein